MPTEEELVRDHAVAALTWAVADLRAICAEQGFQALAPELSAIIEAYAQLGDIVTLLKLQVAA